MVNRSGNQFHFDPATYIGAIRTVPAYDELQDAVAEATAGIQAEWVLELGVGTGKRLGGCSTSIQRRSWSASTRVRRCSLPRPRMSPPPIWGEPCRGPTARGSFDLVSALAVHLRRCR
jgi:hypothetical protein